jgi:hypothetical protein
MLIDSDAMMPGNVARHRADLTQVGKAKVEAVGRMIERTDPTIEIQIARIRFEDAVAHGHVPIDSNVLIIGATGDEASEHVLSEFCNEHRVPALHAWLEADGQVLRLFRVVPGRDPTFLDVATMPPPGGPPELPRGSKSDIRAVTCGDVVLPGSASNLHAAGNFVVRVALDVIGGEIRDDNHWLFAPGGYEEEGAPSPLHQRFGTAGFSLNDGA